MRSKETGLHEGRLCRGRGLGAQGWWAASAGEQATLLEEVGKVKCSLWPAERGRVHTPWCHAEGLLSGKPPGQEPTTQAVMVAQSPWVPGCQHWEGSGGRCDRNGDSRKLLGVTDIFTILIVVAISQVHMCRDISNCTFNVCSLVSYVSSKLLKITEPRGSNFYHICILHVGRQKKDWRDVPQQVNSG